MPRQHISIALIAHNGRKEDMVSFVKKRMDFFQRPDVELWATRTTGSHLHQEGLSKIRQVQSGPLGGDTQIAAMITEGRIDAVLFFRDPLFAHPHEPDIQMLMRICDVHLVPLATNFMTAKYLIDTFQQWSFGVHTGNLESGSRLDFSGTRILLVEDNPFNMAVLNDFLQNRFPGVHIDTAENGQEALSLVQQEGRSPASAPFDLVLMDVNMPFMDGIQAVSRIRSMPGPVARMPVIALTSMTTTADSGDLLQSGFDGVIGKPFEPDDLMEVLLRFFNSKR